MRERESTSLPGTYLTYTCLGAVFAFYFTLQAAFLNLCCDTQADTNKSYAQKYFVLFFLADSMLHYPVPKVALHLDALVRGRKREQYLYLGARPH